MSPIRMTTLVRLEGTTVFFFFFLKTFSSFSMKHPGGHAVSTHKLPNLKQARSRVQLMTVWPFIAQNLSLSQSAFYVILYRAVIGPSG